MSWESMFGPVALLSAFVGGVVGVFVDRIAEWIASRPLFSVNIGGFQHIAEGSGITLNVENVGFSEIHEYSVALFHPKRGSLGFFIGDPLKLSYPQQPHQKHQYRCVTQPPAETESTRYMKYWLRHEAGKEVTVPTFEGFSLHLVLRNSELILFADEQLGNNIAKQMFEELMGTRTSQVVDDVFYVSKARFWVEWLRRYRTWKMLREVKMRSKPVRR